MKIGDIEILPVVDGRIVGRLPSTKPLPDEGSSAWHQQDGMFHSDGFIESTVGGLLVRAGDRLALVDAGLGQPLPGGYSPPTIAADDDDDPIIGPLRANGVPEERVRRLADDLGRIQVEQGRLPVSLSALGVEPEEVTDLVFTHLHFDHIGWATAEGSAFFPNATIRCASADLEHFLPGTPEDFFTGRVYGAVTVAERLGPVLDRVETWETDGGLFTGVDVRLAPGHTPGSSVIVISDGTQRAMLLGDIIHCPLELMEDDFNLLVDQDQALGNSVREAYARELEGSDVPVAASHFPGLQFGRLLPSEGTRRWVFESG
jgi:glyoxylase-like metal-dependent hydrolase (beta-lactamase superfamily II)